jgi:hypothetical protein
MATDVVASAKFYAQLNYALANAAIASWDAKSNYNSWRPVTAIHYPDTYLASNRSVYDSNWTPLLVTPNHQDYLSSHASFSGAATTIIKMWNNNSDIVDIMVSSNVTTDNVGVITKHLTNLTAAAYENGLSRVFGGIHFEFSSNEGNVNGAWVAEETLKVFDEQWNKF